MERAKIYYHLAKPGIVYGNAVSFIAGFLLAASLQKHFSVVTFLGMLIGISLVIACGCVINNYIDREIDAKMARTKNRASVTGQVDVRSALKYAIILGLLGFILLLLFTNKLTMFVGAVGLFFYLVVYGLAKRRTPWSTIIGSVSGATPIVAGYTAVTDQFDAAAIILFLSMVLWQMPHFYAIAMYRFDDYKKAGLPVLPVVRGMQRTKDSIMLYIVSFTLVASSLFIFGYTGYTYLIVILLLGALWLKRGRTHFNSKDAVFGRKMFLFSLIVLLVFSAMVAVGALLP